MKLKLLDSGPADRDHWADLVLRCLGYTPNSLESIAVPYGIDPHEGDRLHTAIRILTSEGPKIWSLFGGAIDYCIPKAIRHQVEECLKEQKNALLFTREAGHDRIYVILWDASHSDALADAILRPGAVFWKEEGYFQVWRVEAKTFLTAVTGIGERNDE